MVSVTKEFLEEALGAEISNFVINSGSNLGDGYASILYTIDVELTNAESIQKFNKRSELHLLLKCYPTNPAHQDFLVKGNLFKNELQVYKTFIPELIQFQKEILGENGNIYKPPFPEFFYGRAVDYSELSKAESLCTDPLDNCILMSDLRKDGNFKLANRLLGLDLDHTKLVIAAQAKFHAISWAYKVATNTQSLVNKFPFLDTSKEDLDIEEMEEEIAHENLFLFKDVISAANGINERTRQKYLKSLDRFNSVEQEVTDLYSRNKKLRNPSLNKDSILRVPQIHIEDEEPWLVWTHGDCWMNNMLFRYDAFSGRPMEVLFVDLQSTGEEDPLTDLVYNLYTSTSAELRQKHLDDLLKLYTTTFTKICDNLKVPPLPDFNLCEVRRRFHRAKVLGFSTAFMFLPLILTEEEHVVDMETLEGEGSDAMVGELVKMAKSVKGNSMFERRVLELVAEMYGEGII